MLFFHGTRGDRALLRSIAREGLRAQEHWWTRDLLEHEGQTTFVSPSAIASHGGDPVAFAMGFRRWKGPRSPGDGWIVVGDLAESARALVRAVVPNRELAEFFEARWILPTLAGDIRTASGKSIPVLRALVELGRRDDLRKIAKELTPRGTASYKELHLDGVSFASYCAFANALMSARTADEALRAANRQGIRWERAETMHCELCVDGLAHWTYELPAWVKLECAMGESLAFDWHFARRDLFGQELVATARMVARWFDGVATSAMDEGFAALVARKDRRANARSALFEALPLDPARVPEAWRPNFGERFRDGDLRAPDVQWVCDPIPPEFILGAMHLSSGPKFRSWAKPNRGQTLSSKLAYGARWLAQNSARPDTIFDG